MKICSKKDLKVMTGIMAASLLLGGCTANVKKEDKKTELKGDPNVKTEIDLKKVADTEYDQKVMDDQYKRYCFDLLKQTVTDYGSNGNVMISPASIMMALDMVAAGAKGDSLKQLTDLFAVDQGPLTQQAYASALMDKINKAEDVDFSCANAVWSNKTLLGDSVNLEYVDYIQKTFKAEYSISVFDKKTPDQINDWVDKKTDHMIKKIVNNLDESTAMVLVNAIAFEGKWADPYDESQVMDGEFTNHDGNKKTVKFLHGGSDNYFETEKAKGFMKEYKGGKYAFLTILPNDEKANANEFAKSFTAEDYEKFVKSISSDYIVVTKMPEFKSEFEFGMTDTLENLGCKNIFHAETADLSGIAGVKGDLYVSKVLHKTFIEVNATGTKAAAATAVMVDAAGAEPVTKEIRQVICDRPYVYAIVDTETMLPVFVGTVNEL